MTNSDANKELRRIASKLLRENANDPDKALRPFTMYLLDDGTSGGVLRVFIRATLPYADADHDMQKDALAFLVRLSQTMPRAVTWTRRTAAHRIQFADQRIREVRQRIAALDRELAQLPKAFLALPVDDPMVSELRAESARLGNERNKAYLELLELLELDETPTSEMGSA